ncbi:MAG: class I SAM-dependent methyltransferase [Isosphaeraceae bacterium]|nr:class I SAM-dependent methyltransferase [Isosphaeraceae bacterium]
MKRWPCAITVMIGAVLLVQAGSAQQPGPAGGQRPPRPGGPPNPLLQVFDTNRDGTLSADEIDAAAAKLRALDTSQDGKLTGDELLRALGRPRGPEAESGSDLQKPPLPKDEGEKRILAALDEARKGTRYANVSPADGRLLRQLTEAVGAKRVVELGTSTGESGLWFAMALRKTGGHLYTHDIDPERIKVARGNFQRAGVEDLITIIEGDAHETVKQHKEPIDVLFIDADKPGYPDYLAKLLPLVRPGGLILAHNMRRPAPDPRYIEAITTNPDLDTSFVLMEGAGIGVTLKKR